MNTTFSIEITFRINQAMRTIMDGEELFSPKHSFYCASVLAHRESPKISNFKSPWITEWDDEDKPTELMPPNEALFALLDHVKQAIIEYKP